jgi:uncharacterized membrane protein YbhN (UPF0104 family)
VIAMSAVPEPTRSGRPWLRVAAGLTVSIGLLAFLFSRVEPAAVFRALADASLPGVAAVILTHTGALFLRVVRWRWLLVAADVGPPPVVEPRDRWLVTDSMFFGWLGNVTLPARLGEFARPALYCKRSGRGFAPVLGTLAVERAADLIVIVGMLAGLLLLAPLPEHLPEEIPQVARAFGGLAALGLVALLLLARPSAKPLPGRLGEALSGFRAGLGALRSPGTTLKILGATATIWWIEAACTWVALLAFGQEASWTAALLTMIAVTLSISVVTVPGGLGVEQGVTMAILAPFGVAAEAGLAISLVTMFGALFWLVPGGLFGMWRQGVGLASTVEEAVGSD